MSLNFFKWLDPLWPFKNNVTHCMCCVNTAEVSEPTSSRASLLPYT